MMEKKRLINYLAKMLFVLFVFFIMVVGVHGSSAEEAPATQKPSNNPADAADIEWLVFSPTQYRHERELIIRHLYITEGDLKDGHIYIAVADLEGDGSEEILSYIDLSDFCGSLGCMFNIYELRNHKLVSLLTPSLKHIGFNLFMDIDKEGRQKVIGILRNKTMGWRDISLRGGTVWKWNGNNYAGGRE